MQSFQKFSPLTKTSVKWLVLASSIGLLKSINLTQLVLKSISVPPIQIAANATPET